MVICYDRPQKFQVSKPGHTMNVNEKVHDTLQLGMMTMVMTIEANI